ncbi:apoptosis-stimulating of p53 protein 2-like isoform X2 [Mercenaria mercenaria]|uniref:apoptosis-stimulating of p53 protein 2-like isoform X2 n=2 Tax=Mercenaria mercenaria TaxID=6596 RepID=UPI00234ED091|nr:apoptosis-stimulating of p53 protein 2-like isoform X2 [Mercenaria mercenaria]
MATTFSFDSAEEDWDLNTLYLLNSQLESYLKMLPGGGVDMTLSELQEMAARQQQQIESQQQILVAKEQRLKYLKQQEQKQQQLASENDRLRKLRDKVEAQEMKLKKLRALRGQVEQQKASNGNLNYELESIKALFNEKEKELAMAAAKVEEMTRQLEEIRSGRVKASTNTQSPAALAELEKLKKELMIRNKLNENQNNKMAGNRELLAKRKDELARMDNRIHELQMRLKKKRAVSAEMAEQNKNQMNKTNQNNKVINRPPPNIAAVEPFVQDPQNNVAGFGKKDPKYQSLPPSSKFLYPEKENRQRETNNNNVNFNSKQYDSDKSEEYTIPLVVSVDSNNKPMQNGLPSPKQSPVGEPQVSQVYPPYSTPSSLQIPQSMPSSLAPNNTRYGSAVTSRSGVSHFTPKPYGSTYSSSILPNRGISGVPNDQNAYDLQDEIRQSGSGQSSPGSVESTSSGSSKPLPPYPHREGPPQPSKPQGQRDAFANSKGQAPDPQQATKAPQKDNISQNKGPPPVPNRSGNRPENTQVNTGSVPNNLRSQHSSSNSPENLSDTEQTNISVSKGIQKFAGLIAQQEGPKQQGANNNSGGFSNLNHASALGAVTGRSVPSYRYASKSVIANTYLGRLDNEALEKYQKNVLSLHRDLSASSKTDDGSPTEKTVSNNQNEKLKDEEKDSLSPLSSVSSPAGSTPSPSSPLRPPNYPFDFPSTPPHADVASDKVSYKPNTPKNIRRRHSDSDNEEVGKALHKYGINTNANKNPPAQENQLILLENKQGPVEIQATTFSDHIPETVLIDNKGNIVEVIDNAKETNNNKAEDSADTVKASPVTIEVKSSEPKVKKKTNLKNSNSKKNGNRVSFDPLALLLDASLEGELELVRRCAVQVDNVSASNDEGITALHNAICAGHYDIVTFLVEFGCDVNSPDSDGWTPLHCAASCNNLPMVKFLVEHGACIFATTISDHETAAEKCEEDEDGYDGCSEYLYSIQEKLGIMNNGAVYAVFDYAKENSDEVDLNIGDKFTILKKGDEHEKEWWWARLDEKEVQGYIPRNLLGLTPRVIPKVQPNGDV